MGYRIDYSDKKAEYPRTYPVRTMLLTAGILGLFLLGVYRHWPEGAQVLDRLFSTAHWEFTHASLEMLADSLKNGSSLSEAVRVFCRDLIQHGLEYAA